MSTPGNRFRRGLNALGAALDTSGQSFAALQNRDAEAREVAREEELRKQEGIAADEQERAEIQRDIRDRLVELCQSGALSPEQCEAERAKLDPAINAEIPSVLSQPNQQIIEDRELKRENTQSEIANRAADNKREDEKLNISAFNAETKRITANTKRAEANSPNAGKRPRVVKVPTKQQAKDVASAISERVINVGDTQTATLSDLGKKDQANYVLHITSTTNKIMAENDGVSFTQAMEAAAQQADQFIKDDRENNFIGIGDDIAFDLKSATEALDTGAGNARQVCVIDPEDGKEYCKVNGKWEPSGR